MPRHRRHRQGHRDGGAHARRQQARAAFTVTLPLMMPGVLSGCLISLASALGEFGATITFVSNVEGQTRTIPLAIYSATHMPDGDAMALRLTVVSVVLALGHAGGDGGQAHPRGAGPDMIEIDVSLAHIPPAFT